MHTVASLTEAHVFRHARRELWRSILDVRFLFQFRAASVRRPWALLALGGLFLVMTELGR